MTELKRGDGARLRVGAADRRGDHLVVAAPEDMPGRHWHRVELRVNVDLTLGNSGQPAAVREVVVTGVIIRNLRHAAQLGRVCLAHQVAQFLLGSDGLHRTSRPARAHHHPAVITGVTPVDDASAKTDRVRILTDTIAAMHQALAEPSLRTLALPDGEHGP